MPEEKNVINSEFIFDTESVCVKADRYNELLIAEEKLRIIENIFRSNTSFLCYGEFFKFIFGPRGENEDAK